MSGTVIEYDVEAIMRDGTILRADVYRPAGDGPWPVILVRTPYDKQSPAMMDLAQPLIATLRGIMCVIQDTRSRARSDGEAWRPWIHEAADGADSIRWAAGLPDSTGRVATAGGSYLGNVQWMAAAEQPEELVAIAPDITWCDPYDGLIGRGGAIELGISVPWSLMMGADFLMKKHAADPGQMMDALGRLFVDYDSLDRGVFSERPAGAHPAYKRHGIPELGFEAALADDGVAEACRVQGKHDDVKVPSLNTAGWYDIFVQGSLDNFTAHAQSQASRLIVGPWSHTSYLSAQGQVNFGMGASRALLDLQQPWHTMQLDWLEHYLRNEEPKATEPPGPRVKLFVMGINQWRDEDEWPLSRAVDTAYYLGKASTIDTHPDNEETSTHFVYDPDNPVPTVGGALLSSPEYPPGPFDQLKVEQRDDVLVFTSDVLRSSVEVTGRVRAFLRVATDGPSTDWVVRLCDVHEDGTSLNITDGITRAQHSAGEHAEVEVDLWSTSYVFLPGHRIRVQVTSSCFPRWDTNPNTGEPVETASTTRVARQTVSIGGHSGSRIVLPVV